MDRIMSEKTDKFEDDIVSQINTGDKLPLKIPKWLTDIGVISGATVREAKRLGSLGEKTDILITFETGAPIKISAKLSSADYFGNWYSHKRIISEFGIDAFYKLTQHCTKWANSWVKQPSASFFIGVSVCFGKRTGQTGEEFTSVFSYEDIKKIVAGDGSGDGVANCLLVSDDVPNSLVDLISKIRPIDQHTLMDISSNFKVIYRPINTQTERSNRGKCIYAQYIPNQKLPELTSVLNIQQIRELGQFCEVEPNSLNHNNLAKLLKSQFNIDIPLKK